MARKKGSEGLDGSGAMAARRRLGRLLAEEREARQITQEDAAAEIERVPSTLYRIEQGLPGVRIRIKQDIHGLCDLYEVDQETRDGLISLAQATKVKGQFQPDKDLLPPKFDAYLGLEQDASDLETYETELIPGLLQTETYARVVVGIPEDRERDEVEIERRVNLRMRRQEVLRRSKPPHLNVVLNEAVLRRPVGGPRVMAAQLAHLNAVAEAGHVTVRVLQFTVGLHWGLVSGPFVILRFPDGEEPPIVYVEGYTGSLWLKEPKEIKRYDNAFVNLTSRALDQKRSRELIAQAAKEL